MKQDKRKKVRRWILPGEEKGKSLFVAVGRKRSQCIPIVIKALDWVNEHLTLSMKDNGTFNFHMTKEGNISEHTRLAKGRMDLERLGKTAEEIYHRSTQPISLRDQDLRDFVVLLPKNLEGWSKFYWRLYEYKRRKIIYPDSEKLRKMEQEIEQYFDVIYMDELPESPNLLFGMYSDPEGKRFGILLSIDNNYYLMPISEMVGAFANSFMIESVWCPGCGLELAPSMQLCPDCGRKFVEDE